MWNWMKSWGSAATREATVDLRVAKRHPDVSGKYVSLYKHLENRYADVVVLTFGQIEDLLGFALPDAARKLQTWWTGGETDAKAPPYSDAWTKAGRTATPNLLAKTVAFERVLNPR